MVQTRPSEASRVRAPRLLDGRTASPRPGAPAIAYLMPRFPLVTETFVLFEVEALLDSGREVRIYPLLRETFDFEHAAVARLRPRVRFLPLLSLAVCGVNLLWIVRHPLRYLLALWTLIVGTMRSPGHLYRSLLLFPKTVAYAHDMGREAVAHVHAHFADEPATMALVIHRLTGLPFSFTAHGADLFASQVGLTRKLKEAEFSVQVSDFNRSFTLEHAGAWVENKLHVVRCGVDLKTLSDLRAQVAQREDGTQVEGLRILCVASLRPAHDHARLLRALSLLKESAIPFQCRLIGEGPERVQLEALALELGLAREVTFVGRRIHSQVLQELVQSDVVLLLTDREDRERREGISIVLMKALASSKPVVATDLGGTSELITNGLEGLLVTPGDTDGIALALTRLWENPRLRLEMGAAGLARVTSEYSLRLNARKLADLFDASLGPLPAIRPKRPRLVSSD